MRDTLDKIFKTDLIGILTLILINGYSLLAGTVHKYDKVSNTLEGIDITKYIKDVDIVNSILGVLSNGIDIIVIIYNLIVILYLIICIVVPSILDYILLKIGTNKRLMIVISYMLINMPCIFISIILLEPIIILFEAGILGVILNLALSVIICIIIFVVKTIFIIKGTLKYRGITKNGPNESK